MKIKLDEKWLGCFVVVAEHKIRIRRPPAPQVRERRAAYRTRASGAFR